MTFWRLVWVSALSKIVSEYKIAFTLHVPLSVLAVLPALACEEVLTVLEDFIWSLTILGGTYRIDRT